MRTFVFAGDLFNLRRDSMYGRGAGSIVTSTGIALLPNTGSNHKLFVLAASFVAVGVIIFVVSTVSARKSNSVA